MQASVVPPVCAWGFRSRTAVMTGTWVFYVDDYRFAPVLRSPTSIAVTKCTAAVEPNISLFDDTPKAEVIWATYRKRLCAREWQAAGIRVLVDLNVPERHMETCLLGVPAGWRSFATRGYSARPEDLVREHDVARSIGGESAVLLVFGGGKPIKAVCRDLPSAVWVPSHHDDRRMMGL